MLVIIYILVVAWFKSFMTPLIIMAAIPFSLVGILPALTVGPLLAVAAASVVGQDLPPYSLGLWHGFNTPLLMSVVALVLYEPLSQKPGGVANLEVKTLDEAARAIGALLDRVGGKLVSRNEVRDASGRSANSTGGSPPAPLSATPATAPPRTRHSSALLTKKRDSLGISLLSAHGQAQACNARGMQTR